MDQNIHTAINWMDREDVVSLLEGIGMACYDSESTDELRDALRSAIEDGDIDPDMIPAHRTRVPGGLA